MRFFILAAVLVVLVGGYTAYWFTLASATEKGIESWREQARADGTTLRYRALTVGGYPFRVTAVLEAPSLILQGAEGSTTLSTEELQAVALTWRPNHILARSAGPLRIDQALPGGGAVLAATAAEAEGSLLLAADGRPARAALDLHGIAGDSAGAAFSAARAQFHLRRAAPPAAADEGGEQPQAVPAQYDAAVRIDNLTLPADTAPPELGSQIETLDIAATLRGDLPPDRLTAAALTGATLPAILAAWRDGGGVLDVNEMRLAWGPVALTGEGSVSVDAQMRPLGAFTIRLGGHEALLDAIATTRQVEAGQITLAKMLLGGLSRRDAEGRAIVQVPVSAQDGRLFLGPFPILSLPPLLP